MYYQMSIGQEIIMKHMQHIAIVYAVTFWDKANGTYYPWRLSTLCGIQITTCLGTTEIKGCFNILNICIIDIFDLIKKNAFLTFLRERVHCCFTIAGEQM